METKLLNIANEYLQELRQMEDYHFKRSEELSAYSDCILKRRKAEGKGWYYSVRKRGDDDFKYLGSDRNSDVKAVKECRFHKTSLSHIGSNIRTVESMIANLERTGMDGVNDSLPDLYKVEEIESSRQPDNLAKAWKENAESMKKRFIPYRPEELNIKTDDGTMVRSKSEALIYNYLLQMGVVFAYELPLKIGNRYYYPDFTLLSELDYKSEIIIEHQGMMGTEAYRDRFAEKLYGYLRAGYVQGINIFYTFDQLDGGFDKTPIADVVRRIRME